MAWIELKDIVGSILGALLGFAGAYIMYRIQRKSDREEAARKDAMEKMATYDFAREQLTQALKGWIKQENSLLEFSRQYKEAPFIDHPHVISVNPALRSLVLLDRKELRLALNHHCGEKAGARVFQAMASIIDYYNTHQETSLSGILSGKEVIYKELLRFDDLYAELGNTITKTIDVLRQQFGANVPVADKLNKILVDFYVRHPSPLATVDVFMEDLVQPCLNLVKDPSIPQVHIIDVIIAAKRAQKSFLRIRNSAEDLAAAGQEYAAQVKWMQRRVLKVLEILSRQKGK